VILGLAMSGDDLAGIIVSSLILVYLVYALVFPEKL
jgi:K+-transporting ATPase KdpF subunit